MSATVSLPELAEVIRSKNAGPYEIGFDIIFRDFAGYQLARKSGVITAALIARLYRIPEGDVRVIRWFDPAKALKITIPRERPAGGPGERDLYGAQQHAPLLSVTFPVK